MKKILGKDFRDKYKDGWKSAVHSAFNLATAKARMENLPNCSQLQIHQFRRLLLALKQYFEYYAAYTKIDRDGDNTLSIEEFKLARGIVEKWSGPIQDIGEAFKEIDKDNSGYIDFEEFCYWAIEKSFGIQMVDQDDLKEKLNPTWRNQHKKQKTKIYKKRHKQKKIKGKQLKTIFKQYGDINLLPTGEEQKKERKILFR